MSSPSFSLSGKGIFDETYILNKWATRTPFFSWDSKLKMQIRESQIRAITAANKELINFYWKIGKTIVERQEELFGYRSRL